MQNYYNLLFFFFYCCLKYVNRVSRFLPFLLFPLLYATKRAPCAQRALLILIIDTVRT